MKFYTNVDLFKNKILLKGYENGKKIRLQVDYKPYHFVASREPSEFTDLDGNHLKKVSFPSVFEARKWVKENSEIINSKIYGLKDYLYNFISDYYPDEVVPDFNLISIVYMDIEVDSTDGFPDIDRADKAITSIALRKDEKTVVLSTVEYKVHKPNVTYIRCKSEKELLEKFLLVWKRMDPDIVSGWNVEFFDIKYLIQRLYIVVGEDSPRGLSPWGIVESRENRFDGTTTYIICGVSVIDMMNAYKKFSFKNQESYALNAIAFKELKKKKIDYSEYESLQNLMIKNPQLYVEYNINDNDLVFELNAKLGFIEQIVTLANMAKVTYSDAFTSVRLWDVMISNNLKKSKIIIPTNTVRQHKTEAIAGAYVKDPVPGKYEWVVNFDLDSLYSHLVMEYNISPETIIKCIPSLRDEVTITDILEGKLRNNEIIRNMIESQDASYTPNGSFFRRNKKGFLPKILYETYQKRTVEKSAATEAKKKLVEAKKNKATDAEIKQIEAEIAKHNNMQMAIKIALNSAYGVLTNEYFRWYDQRLAEGITYAGQLAIRWIAQDFNIYLNKLLGTENIDYVITMDTDSVYLNVGPLVKQKASGKSKSEIIDFLDKLSSEVFQQVIKNSYDKLANYTNAFEQKMSMKRENIADYGIFVAKKKYVLNTWDKEGVRFNEPELEIKGIEAVKSSTPYICREKIKDALKIMLTGDKASLMKVIDEFREVFVKLPFEEVAATSSISEMRKWEQDGNYGKGTPIWIRGAILYNKLIREKDLSGQYPFIKERDKVKWCRIKVPNPINNENVISAPAVLPEKLGLREYIDYDTQFEKVFVQPLNNVAKSLGWNLLVSATLDEFFI